jgi:uncharacterized membrane-anchored protein
VFNIHANKDDDCIKKKIEELLRELLNDKSHVYSKSKNVNENDKDDEDVKSILSEMQIELF